MIQRRPHKLWAYTWKFVTPLLLLFSAAFTFITLKPLSYGSERSGTKYEYPSHITGIGV